MGCAPSAGKQRLMKMPSADPSSVSLEKLIIQDQ
jgi:hypothetical protein